jgi:hypothetical protein
MKNMSGNLPVQDLESQESHLMIVVLIFIAIVTTAIRS